MWTAVVVVVVVVVGGIVDKEGKRGERESDLSRVRAIAWK